LTAIDWTAYEITPPFGVDLKNTVRALETTTIDLSLALFQWAQFRSTRAARPRAPATAVAPC